MEEIVSTDNTVSINYKNVSHDELGKFTED